MSSKSEWFTVRQTVIILSGMQKLPRTRMLWTGVITLLTVLSLSSVGASSANISHSYRTTAQITNGSIVSLDPKQTDYVVPANTDNGGRLIGVAVASDDSLLAVDPTSGRVQVATSGNANTLVSTVNGDIKVGDQIAISPFNGVGMKAEPGLRIIGLAQTGFNADSDGATTREVTTKDGKKTPIHLGFVRISIGVGTAGGGSGSSLNGLQRFAKSLTGRTISTPRIIVSIIVALVALIALTTLIYASIYGSIISVGRNPLARNAIFRTLGSVLGMAALTGVVALLTIFFLLR
jgi:hypothetical protein